MVAEAQRRPLRRVEGAGMWRLSAKRLGSGICTGEGGEVERAPCVRGKMGAERRRDAERGRKRCRGHGAFSGGNRERTVRKGLAAGGRGLRYQGKNHNLCVLSREVKAEGRGL